MLPPNVAESLAIHEMYKKTIDLKFVVISLIFENFFCSIYKILFGF